MTDTITREVVELEELLSEEVPCGGNDAPVSRDCPWGAPAILVSTHRCRRMSKRAAKCLQCFLEWHKAATLRGAFCPVCCADIDVDAVYTPL